MGATLGNAPFSSDYFVFSRRINKLRFFSIAPASLVANVLDDHGPFNTPIPSIYINSYKKVIDTFFSIHEVYNPLIFTDELILTITEGFTYTIFVKVRYNYDQFFMAGIQFGFIYSVDANIEAEVMDIVTARLDYYVDVYEIKPSDVMYVQSFRQKNKKLLSFFL